VEEAPHTQWVCNLQEDPSPKIDKTDKKQNIKPTFFEVSKSNKLP